MTKKSKNNSQRKYDKQYKIISILLILFSLLLFFSLISYSRADQSNAQVSFSELLSLFFGNDEVSAKAATTKNWLSLFGAVIADFFFNKTVGFWIIGLPWFIGIWSLNLFTGKEISYKLIKNTVVYFILIILFSGLTGTLMNVSWVFPIAHEWAGNIGLFIADIFSSIIGTLGTFLILTTGIVITVILGTDIKFSKYFNIGKGIANDIKTGSKDLINDVKNDIYINKDKTEHKNNENKSEIIDDKKVESVQSDEKIETNDLDDEGDNEEDNNVQNILTRKSPNIRIIRPKQIKNPKDLVSKQDLEKSEKEKIDDIKKDSIDEPDNNFTESEIIEPQNPENQNKNHEFSEEDVFNKDEITDEKSKKNDEITKDKTSEENSNQITEENNSDLDLEDNDEDNSDYKNESEQRNLNVTVNKLPENKKEEKREPQNPLGTDIHDEEIVYTPPGFDLLTQEGKKNEVSEIELKTNAQILQEKLETFKIYIEDLGVTPGPVVTQYEFVPAPGIKISKIEGLADDLAMALKAKGIRIIAPIPEKGTVGIEIPNANPSMVTFNDVVRNDKFIDSNQALPIALGKTISGEVYTIDLAKMPHLLIAGSTGSGKSVGINTIIASLLYKKHPSELKFVLVDPKKVELMQYALLRDHFLAVSPDIDSEIVNTPTDAVVVLKAAVVEMERRYDILSKVGQRNIKDYNKKVREGKIKDNAEMKHKSMPYIVVIIDELADLMLTAAKEVEEPITRLAQMARAVGIHLIIATQRPSVDVITGLIKANFPARISYAVSSKIDSRTILDMQGAETLLGMGDMLCLPAGQPKPIRIQNSFIDTDEVENICNFINDQEGYSRPYFLPSLNETQSGNGGIAAEDRDVLFEEAARLIVRNQQGSVSLLQRRLKIGYARAGRIVDELEDAGIVGPFDGSKARQVLIESEADLEAIL